MAILMSQWLVPVKLILSLGNCRRALERPKVALGCASSNSYASLELSKLPERIHNSMYTSWALNNSLLSQKLDRVFFSFCSLIENVLEMFVMILACFLLRFKWEKLIRQFPGALISPFYSCLKYLRKWKQI